MPKSTPLRQRRQERENEDARVDGDVIEPRDVAGVEARERRYADVGDGDTTEAADNGDGNAFGEHLPDEAAAAGAEGAAQSNLARPLGTAGEEQVGDVGTGDQQHEPDGTEQQVQRLGHLPHGRLPQRHQRHGAQGTVGTEVTVGILVGALRGEGIDLLLGDVNRRAVGKAAGHRHDMEPHRVAPLGIVGIERQPHVDVRSR